MKSISFDFKTSRQFISEEEIENIKPQITFYRLDVMAFTPDNNSMERKTEVQRGTVLQKRKKVMGMAGKRKRRRGLCLAMGRILL